MSKKIYKIGEVCNFKELTNLVDNKKINAIVADLFCMKKNTEYRSFEKYVIGLEEIIDKIMTEKPFNEMYFVLFIDNSIVNNKEIYENIKRIINKIENRGILFHYDCPILKNKEGLHLDLLGSIIRFFPYFDFENNPFNFTLCIDVDNMVKRLDKFKIITKIAFDNNADFCFKSVDSELIINRKSILPRAINVIKHKIPYIISGHSHCGFGKLPMNVLTDFLIDVKRNPKKYQKVCNVREGIEFKYFCYGIDEYFLNNIMIEEFIKNNKKVIPYVPYNFFGTIGIGLGYRKNIKLQKFIKKITPYYKFTDMYKYRFLN